MYLWILVVGGFLSFFASMGIGANDAANAFATSICSKSLSLKKAIFLACIFESAGAILMGSHVANTIRKGIADYECFQQEPYVLMYGCMWVCFVYVCICCTFVIFFAYIYSVCLYIFFILKYLRQYLSITVAAKGIQKSLFLIVLFIFFTFS